jgi:hypothetical protein
VLKVTSAAGLSAGRDSADSENLGEPPASRSIAASARLAWCGFKKLSGLFWIVFTLELNAGRRQCHQSAV